MLKRLLPFAAILISFVAIFGGGNAAQSATNGHYIVVLNDTGADPGAAAAQQAAALGGQVSHVYRHALKGYAVTLPTSALPALQANPLVRFVSEDAPVSAAGQPSGCSPFSQCLPFGIDRIDGDRSSTRSGDGKGAVNINVAVLDSGIDPTHPDLNVVGGTNCSNGKSSDFSDVFGHGTMVAGTLAARDNAFGVVGVAPGAQLWSVRVLNDQAFGSVSAVLCGVDWVTATRTDADPTNDIAVANMSIGGKGSDDGNCGKTKPDALHIAICSSVAAGVTYVVAASNDGVDFQSTIPAAYDEVLTATAMADHDGQPGGLAGAYVCPTTGSTQLQDDTPAFFSNFATLPSDQAHTVAAPGVCVASTALGGSGYGEGSGTSFASPHVAGTVALCIASGPCAGLTPAQIVQKIVADAAAYNQANPGYGFTGDPQHSPDPSKYYGYLIRAALY